MAEMRLIDSNDAVCSYVETWTCNCLDYGTQKVMAVDDISTLPEIDPETLPIVQELRAELEKVKKERDELASLSGKLVVLCEPPQKWRPKLFRKYQGAMIGDYMGSGYPFIDDFNRIWADFEETASAGAYDALRKAADVAIEKVKKEEQ